MSDVRVGLFETLEEYTSWNPKTLLFRVIILLILCDLGCAVALSLLMDGFLHFRFATESFRVYFLNYTGDCLYLAIGRCVFLPLLAYCAVKSGEEELVWPLSACCCSVDHTNKIERKSWDSQSESGQPLLSRNDCLPYDTIQNVSVEDKVMTPSPTKKPETLEESFIRSMKGATFRKNIWLGVLFLLSALTQVYIGFKCISFNYLAEDNVYHGVDSNRMKSVVGALMGIGVLWANALSWALRELVSKGYRLDGELITSLHPHRLHLHITMAGHWCDICSTQIKDGKAYRCKLCDFDVCLRCFNKRDTVTMDGVLRGDKGTRKETDLNPGDFLFRIIDLAKLEYLWLICALFSLGIYNLLSLLLPRLQGSILDSVVNEKESKFNRHIILYLYVSLATGLFSGLQSLCFSIVGRKMAKTVRCKLFKGIIIQDVAFFDGNSSGQLTSRLTNDVSFMVQPVQSMMGSFLSNTILFVGGVSMCFVTSWQLSMLAFTTIGPILHITQVYAEWSSHLNRQIFAALASANGYAVEALTNIRTVKAFTTEKMEEEKYTDSILDALQKGMQDAIGGAGMYTINSYLDLGAGVLILWYGGRLAMDSQSGLSPGQLITFQLYWNMINSAYKGLVDILTNLTRSAGAASRVFSLMDSLPDIDLDSGQPLDDQDFRGEIELRDVHYSYQMRPTHKVLDGINLNIPSGTTCALVGRSGGGKSTIVNLILRFYDPLSGEILFDGTNVKSLRLRDLRKEIGLVAQNTELFAGTIEENISYGMEPGSFTRQDVVLAATKACAHEFITEMSEGYETRVGERGVRISGGQKQRIAIARVFLRKPKILLLDEATSALDAVSEAKVQEALDRLVAESGATVILVAHRLSTVVNANQIAVVGDGKILEVGTHETLLGKNGPYATLVRKQLAKHNSILHVDEEDVDST